MRVASLLLILCACSAPDVADPVPSPGGPPPDGEPPPPEEAAPPASPEDRPPTPEDLAAAAGEPPPSPEDLAAAAEAPTGEPPAAATVETPFGPLPLPYTAWTVLAPLELTGPEGAKMATLQRAGVRVEVTSIEGARANVICTGCPGTLRDAGGWLPADALQPARSAISADSPLSLALAMRAKWAKSQELPPGSDRLELCRLVDLGFTEQGSTATWEVDGGRLVGRREGEGWTVAALTAPTQRANPGWRCRVSGEKAPGAPGKPPAAAGGSGG